MLRNVGTALLGIIPSFLNFWEYILWLKFSPASFGLGRKFMPAVLLPSWRSAQPPEHCWHLPVHCPPRGMPVLPALALLGSGRGAEGRAGLTALPSWGARPEEQRNPIQPGSRQHCLVSSSTWLLPSQQNRIALCLQSMCVCVCLHAWVHANKLSKSTLSSLSVLWRCATPQILEKPCGAIYFIFEHS